MSLTEAQFGEELVALLPRLRRFARTLTRHDADGDDLVQLAVERALSRRSQWQPSMNLLNWTMGIMRHAWIDELRRRTRRPESALTDEVAESVPDRLSTDAPTLLSLRQGLDRLPDEQRLAVSLVLIEGLSYQEAADVMGVPVGTLTSRVARGRYALADLLRDPPT
jgi:RNA polymerase sigma-70 factor, ECF subfamily